MPHNLKNILIGFLALALFSVLLVACDDDEVPVIDDEADTAVIENDEGIVDEEAVEEDEALIEDEDLLDDEDGDLLDEEGGGALDADTVADDEPDAQIELTDDGAVLVTPTMIQIEDVLGLPVQDELGATFGLISDFLFNQQGDVEQFIVETEDGERLVLPATTLRADIGGSADTWAVTYTGAEAELASAVVLDEAVYDYGDSLLAEPLPVGVSSDFDSLFRASQFEDVPVLNLDGEELGEIEQSLVDFLRWRVTFGVIDVGGFLEIGEKQVPIPFPAFLWSIGANAFLLTLQPETLEAAPEVNLAEEVGIEEETGIFDFWEEVLRVELGPTEPFE
ncbi:MAG: PRC-barrel domain-containing protein [Candidatus Promineifilaceae bacterium]|nr:PRC-barrel domain-containing protein [Candidatus Promineifilaceae bacterium]